MSENGWDEAAEGYEGYFVPRFAPWVGAAVSAVVGGALPDGPIVVPCCGTFPELPALVRHFPDREIVGIDASAGMVRLARERASGLSLVGVRQDDASVIGSGCAAVVSVFGLQQLPDPVGAMVAWTAALRAGGRLSVVFWPHVTESDGPFAAIADTLRPHVQASDRSWEAGLAGAVRGRGAVVSRDEALAYPMTHPSAAAFFEAFTRHGPLRGLATRRGEEFVAGLRAEFLRRAPEGEWTHSPRARLIVAERIVTPG